MFLQRALTTEEYLEGSASRAPYIIAVGDSKAYIFQYFIILDSQLMPLPGNSNFLNALDVVFKLHFIFNIKYDINLKSFWIFFQKYFYEINCSVSPVIKDVFLKLHRLQLSE